MELRLVIAYSILAIFLLVATVAGIQIKRRRAARRLRLRGVKVEQGARQR